MPETFEKLIVGLQNAIVGEHPMRIAGFVGKIKGLKTADASGKLPA